jgi:hypothetical protein
VAAAGDTTAVGVVFFLPITLLAFPCDRAGLPALMRCRAAPSPDPEGRFRMATPQTTPFRALLGRMTWMLFGPMLLFFAAGAVATRSKGFFSFTDLAYFLVLAAMLGGRWLEFRCGDPRTATGEPASDQHLRGYTLAVGVAGLTIWGVATLFRTFWAGI